MASQQVVVERAETPVMFKRVADDVAAIGRGMQEVEDAVGLRGREVRRRLRTTTASTASASSFAMATTRRRSDWRSVACPADAMRGNVSQENRPRSMS